MPPRKKQQDPEYTPIRRPLTLSEAVSQLGTRELSRRLAQKHRARTRTGRTVLDCDRRTLFPRFLLAYVVPTFCLRPSCPPSG